MKESLKKLLSLVLKGIDELFEIVICIFTLIIYFALVTALVALVMGVILILIFGIIIYGGPQTSKICFLSAIAVFILIGTRQYWLKWLRR